MSERIYAIIKQETDGLRILPMTFKHGFKSTIRPMLDKLKLHAVPVKGKE